MCYKNINSAYPPCLNNDKTVEFKELLYLKFIS